MVYVFDGCRSLHHRTNFQDYLIKVFGFSMEYVVLNVIYERRFETMVYNVSLQKFGTVFM